MDANLGTRRAIRTGPAVCAMAAVITALTGCDPEAPPASPRADRGAESHAQVSMAADRRDAGALAAAATEIAQTAGYRGQTFPKVFVVDHTCAYQRLARPPSKCRPKQLSAGVRAALAKALSGLGPVEYVRSTRGLVDIKNQPPVEDGGVIVYFGDARISGRQAKISALAYVGPLGAAGGTFQLRQFDEGWRVVRQVGAHWIS